jgi:general secretion pathway protein H
MRAVRARGFTLIELLVVLVIIGILVSFATLSIGSRALDDRMQVEAQRLDRLLRLAAEEAEVKGIDLGFRFSDEGYEFLVLSPEGKWLPYDGDPILRPRALPMNDPFVLTLQVEGRNVPPAQAAKDQDKPVTPQVLVLSSGEVTPFALTIGAVGLDAYYLEQGDALGRFTLERKART